MTPSALQAGADPVAQAASRQKPANRESADRDDQLRPQQAQLPFEPEGAELALDRRRHAVTGAGRRPAGIAARDRGAVEGRVELVLVEVEPPAQRLPGTATPRSEFRSLDDPGSLAVDERALAEVPLQHRPGLERKPCLGAGAAAAVVGLERCQGAVRRPASGHPRRRISSRTRRPCGRCASGCSSTQCAMRWPRSSSSRRRPVTASRP